MVCPCLIIHVVNYVFFSHTAEPVFNKDVARSLKWSLCHIKKKHAMSVRRALLDQGKDPSNPSSWISKWPTLHASGSAQRDTFQMLPKKRPALLLPHHAKEGSGMVDFAPPLEPFSVWLACLAMAMQHQGRLFPGKAWAPHLRPPSLL